ncbi:MAG: hypothetical protein QN160_10310 [Armatimonadota bacterium]|nr:hypothetical protein [Armatimonadota bacterium]
MSAQAPAAPDVLALPLQEAQAQLAAAGYEVDITETRPPGRVVGQGPLRVIREQEAGGRVRLVVTHERYERIAPPLAPPP